MLVSGIMPKNDAESTWPWTKMATEGPSWNRDTCDVQVPEEGHQESMSKEKDDGFSAMARVRVLHRPLEV